MGVYICNYLSMPLYARIFKLNRKSFCVLASLQMFLLLALRADTIDVDYPTYEAAFRFISTIDFSDMLSRIRIFRTARLPSPFDLESGWMALNWLVSHMGFGYRSVMVLCAAINMYAVGKFVYKYSATPWLSFCIFESFGPYQYMFGVLRQSLALSLVLLAVDAYYKKNRGRAFLLLAFAFFIHRTAILAVILFLLISWNNADKSIFKVSLFMWIPFVAIAPFLYNKLIVTVMSALGKGGYVGHAMQLNNMVLLLLLIGILTILFYKFSNSSTSMEKMFVWSVIVSIYWTTLGMFNDTLSRSKDYFAFFLAFEIPLVLFHCRPSRYAQYGRFAVFIMLLAYMVYSLNGSELVPYAVCF